MATTSLPQTDRAAGRDALTSFACALVFLFAGVSALLRNSTLLLQGRFADPRVLGGVHWITLGWISVSIFGALRVFTGVALGADGLDHLLRRKLFLWGRAFWIFGAVFFPLGLMSDQRRFILPGVLGVGVGLLLFSAHILPALIRARRGGLTRAYLVIAFCSLWGAWLLGGSAAHVRAGVNVGLPPGYFLAHILLAAFGWVGSTVVGVGTHLIPMFAMSQSPRQWPAKAALPFWGGVLVFGAVGAYFPRPYLFYGWLCAGIGFFLWVTQIVYYIRARLRAERDPGLFLAFSSTLTGVAAWIGFAVFRLRLPFIGLIVVGWLGLFTLGVYHRVIPFLVWYARFASRSAGALQGSPPQVRALMSARLGYFTAAAVLCGVWAWVIGLALGQATCVYSGAALLLLGCLSSLGQGYWLFGNPKK